MACSLRPLMYTKIRLTSSLTQKVPAELNQSLNAPQSLGRLAFSHSKSSKKYEPLSEYPLGSGLVLTTSTRPQALPSFPFGIRFNPALQKSDLKSNLLCTSLDSFEIQRFSGMGLHTPKYYQMGSGYSIFAMTSPDQSHGFYTRCGTLMYTDRYHRTIIPTFDTVMLLIASCHTVPPILRAKAKDAVSGGLMSCIFRHSTHHSIDKYVELLGNTAGESSSNTTNDKYQPQSGEISQPCLDSIRTCTEGMKVGIDLKLNEFMTSSTSFMRHDLTTKSMQAIFKIFTLESYIYSLAGVFVLYAIFRLVTDVVLTIHFAAGVLTGHVYHSRHKFNYSPQAGTLSMGVISSAAKLLIQTGQVIVGAIGVLATISKMRQHEQISYEPQASNLGSDDGAAFLGKTKPKEAKPQAPKTSNSNPSTSIQKIDLGQCAFGGTTGYLKAQPKPKKPEPPFMGGFGVGI